LSSISFTILAFNATSDSSLLGFSLGGSSVSFYVAFFSVIVYVRLSIRALYLFFKYFRTQHVKGQMLQQPQLIPHRFKTQPISKVKVINASSRASTTIMGT